MIIGFSNTPFVVACVLGLLITALHVCSAFLSGVLKRAATPLAICLHLGAIVLLFFAGAELDLVVTCLMASVLIYVLVGYISYVIGKNKEAGNDV